MTERPHSPLILTIDEAAAHLGVRPSTIRNWVLRGQLEPLRRGAHPLRFHLLDVARCHADRQPRSWHDRQARLAAKWEEACAREEQMRQ